MCDNVCIEVQEIVENISIEVRDFSVYNILSPNTGNSATTDENGLLFVPESSGGVSVHNDLQGLNDGDYIHFTQLEKQKFDSIPNSFAPVATSNDYNDLDNLPTIPTPITLHSQLNLDDGTNPHGTTKQDVGLGDVPNLNTTDAVNKAHEHTNFSVLNGTEESFTTALKNAYNSAVSWITTNGTNLINHLTNYSNPHSVTKSQVGLGNADNTSDLDKPISTATQNALNNKADLVAGKIPASQLPAYVDDVLEFANLSAFPVTGETGIIYVALDTNFTYRWGGSAYFQLGGGGGTTKIIGLVNDAVTVLSASQPGGANTIMHSFLIPANEISNSLIEVDFFAVRTIGTTNPSLNFNLYVSNNNDLTGGIAFNIIGLNNNNTGQQIRFNFFTESNKLYRVSENVGASFYASASVDFTQPVYFHFYINNGGAISADSTRYFRHINVKAIKSL